MKHITMKKLMMFYNGLLVLVEMKIKFYVNAYVNSLSDETQYVSIVRHMPKEMKDDWLDKLAIEYANKKAPYGYTSYGWEPVGM